MSTFRTAPFCLGAELCPAVTSDRSGGGTERPNKPRHKKHPSSPSENNLRERGLQRDQEHGNQEQKLALKYTHTRTNQDYSGLEIMQTNLARNELQNTFIFSYSETLIKSQLLRSYSISGGITVFRTPLLMHTTSQSKRIRAQFPDANDLILSYLAVYI